MSKTERAMMKNIVLIQKNKKIKMERKNKLSKWNKENYRLVFK